MIIEEIKAWLNSEDRDYAKGLFLYSMHGQEIESKTIVQANYQLWQSHRVPEKLFHRLLAIHEHSKIIPNQSSSITGHSLPPTSALPSNNTNAIVPKVLPIGIEPTKNPAHKENGTVNIKLNDASIMKLHVRLVEKVNGKELMMGASAGINTMPFADFLKRLYSGEAMDLIVCSLNKRLGTGGERVSLKNVISTVHREWVDSVVDDVNSYPIASQKLLKELRLQWLPWWVELCDFHSKLKVVNDTAERIELAKRIELLRSKCQDCWDAAKHIKQWGCVPKDFVMPKVADRKKPTDAGGMMKEHENLIANISKMRKALRVNNLEGKKLEKKKKALAEALERRDFLRRALGMPKIDDK